MCPLIASVPSHQVLSPGLLLDLGDEDLADERSKDDRTEFDFEPHAAVVRVDDARFDAKDIVERGTEPEIGDDAIEECSFENRCDRRRTRTFEILRIDANVLFQTRQDKHSRNGFDDRALRRAPNTAVLLHNARPRQNNTPPMCDPT